MDARAKTVKEILHSGDQYLVPFFQRHYSWRRKNWDRLWADIIALVEDDDAKSQHFLGPLVCTPTDHVPGEVTPYQLIDGQQRLTTLSVFLAALAEAARRLGLGELADEIAEDFLVHKRKKGLQRFRLIPRTGDREVLQAVISGQVDKAYRRDGIVQAWTLFRKRIEAHVANGGASERIMRGLLTTVTDRLSLVVITIAGENPYEIFESLNSTGLPLEQSDLIRNYLFMQIPLADQDEFNQEHWQAFERMFEADGTYPPLQQTAFYRNYVMLTGSYSKRHEIFVDFKALAKAGQKPTSVLVADLKKFAAFEQYLRRASSCPLVELRRPLVAIEALDISTANPLVMFLFGLHADGMLTPADLLGCLTDLQSFVLRRSLCGESTRPYNRWFVAAIKEIKASPRTELQQFWLSKGWPDDVSLRRSLESFPIYRRETAKARLLLETIEVARGHKEQASLAKATIEHVLPQTINEDAAGRSWQQMLGADWSAKHQQLLHTLGNLTLSAYNGNLSRHPFERKKEILAQSKIGLNDYFGTQPTWDAEAIVARTSRLCDAVIKLWPRPTGGPQYIAPSVTDSQAVELSKRELCLRYWTVAAEAWTGMHAPLKMARVRGWDWLGFGVRRKNFNYYTWLNRKQRWIAVGFSTTGKSCKDDFLRLRQRSAEIESALGAPLLWSEDAGETWTNVSLLKRDSDPLKESEWHEQHAWLLKHLLLLESAVRPHLNDE